MGKTPMQLEWARHVPGNVLILAPLAVAAADGARRARSSASSVTTRASRPTYAAGITITNYEMLEHFDPALLRRRRAGRVEHPQGLRRQDAHAIIEAFAATPYRLACTATPAPNDYMELGNHAEFLGVMSRVEMLAMFFVHDGGETQKWRLKGHAEAEFWKWLASWAVCIRKPSDLGYDDGDFVLPELVMHEITVKVDKPTDGYLFPVEARDAAGALAARARPSPSAWPTAPRSSTRRKSRSSCGAT
jgi:hypothetical protein